MPVDPTSRSLLQQTRQNLADLEAEIAKLNDAVANRDEQIAALKAQLGGGQAPAAPAAPEAEQKEAFYDATDEMEVDDTLVSNLDQAANADEYFGNVKVNRMLDIIADQIQRGCDDPQLGHQFAQTLRFYLLNPIVSLQEELLVGEREVRKVKGQTGIISFVAPPVTVKSGKLNCNAEFKRMFLETLRGDIEQILDERLMQLTRLLVQHVDGHLRLAIRFPEKGA